MKYVISGVAFSGNKGASGMLTALMQNIAVYDKNARFAVLSYYPKSDAGYADKVTILNGSPKAVSVRFFQCCWVWFARLLHLPRCFWSHGTLKQIAEADYLLDAAGISFGDGREKFTVFNILTILPALAAGTKVIKVSQALGPFKNFANRCMAGIFLPRIETIYARGAKTAAYLEELKLKNVECMSDAAFSLICTDQDAQIARNLLRNVDKSQKIIGISPSQVVFKLCEGMNKDYCGEMEKVAAEFIARGYHCVIFPHSARKGVEKTHNNDLPLLRKFVSRLQLPANQVTVIDDELEAGELRMLIQQLDVLVASRFHAIISAMSEGVPAVVIGWSHKYQEVLEPFELDEFVMPYDSFSAEKTVSMTEELLARRQEISERIISAAENIKADNQRFFQRFSSN